MFDGPGMGPPALATPDEVVEAYSDFTQLQITYEFETFVCCDGQLIALVRWGYTVTRIVYSGRLSPPVVVLIPPTSAVPGTSANRARVPCG